MDGSTPVFSNRLGVASAYRPIATGITMGAEFPAAQTAVAGGLAARAWELDPVGVRDWLDSLREAGVRQSGPALILALSGLLRAPQRSPSCYLRTLRLLKPPVLKTCAGLPKPWLAPAHGPGAAAGAAQRGVTLEQRLYRLMFQNLQQALTQLDRTCAAADERAQRGRAWAVRNLFRFFGRQLRYASLWGCPLPVDAWRDLHDLYVYLLVRGGARVLAKRPLPGVRGVDASQEYKQLLLFALAAQLSAVGVRSSAVATGLGPWAEQAVLDEPQGLHGQCGLYVVELARDLPPRRHAGPLAADFRGWVLVPPPEFFAQLELSVQHQGMPPPGRQGPGQWRGAAMPG